MLGLMRIRQHFLMMWLMTEMGAYVTNFGNPNLTWEKNKTFDTGIDFSIWNSRISGSVDYYNRKTFDLLQDVPLSRTTGFTKQAQNVDRCVTVELKHL